MQINKSLLTNIVAVLIICFSFFVPFGWAKYIFNAGFYALSGAVTNWLAIFMLFERVPFLYGSGVIEKNFERFKSAIKNMIMEQFFTPTTLQNFLEKEEMKINLAPLIESADMQSAFDLLKTTVMESKFGAMIGMFGGESVLDGFREPFIQKLKSYLGVMVSSESFHQEIKTYLGSSALQDDLVGFIDTIVTDRLDELTPKMVKELVKMLINEHLGWLVVWGGVFGAIMGIVASFFGN